MPRYVDATIKSKIIPLYLDLGSIKYTAKSLGVSDGLVRKVLISKKIEVNPYSHRKYSINDNYFERIDTPEKAYVLGILAADGCLHRVSDKSKTVRLSLVSSDVDILNKINRQVESTYPIGYTKSKRLNQQDTAWLAFSSCKMFSDLEKAGLSERKSMTLKFPDETQVPTNLIRHFIRGYFDGDGGLTIARWKNSEKMVVSFCGTKGFLESLRLFLCQKHICTVSKLTKRHDNEVDSYSLRLSGNRICKLFYDLIYLDASIFLDRKKIKFDLFIKNA